jgi:cyclophilin family peptidyl-prolyl cis-trans isomerase
VIETNHGKIEIELYSNDAPKAVENFVGLTFQGYYNGITFHRIVRNLLIQGGDSTSTGKGGRSIFGSEFENEISYKIRFDSPGIVAMANRGPDTNTSQFFITVAPIPFLDGKHTIFGKVIDGLDVVQEIANEPTNDKEQPLNSIIMKKVSIEKRMFN